MASNLPWGHVNVIEEDTKNPNLLFLGTERALFVSIDGGGEWRRFMNGLPTVRIDDILVHPRDNDLIVGTHGRSIYIMDDITPLQQLSGDMMGSSAHLFATREAVQWKTQTSQSRGLNGTRRFAAQNPEAGTAISYYLGRGADEVKITIADLNGETVREMGGPSEPGLHRVQWDMRANPPEPQETGGGRGEMVAPGTYRVTLSVDGEEQSNRVQVLEDVWMN